MTILQSKKDIKKLLAKILKAPVFYGCLIIVLASLIVTKQIVKENASDLFIYIFLAELFIDGILIALLIFADRKSWPTEKKFLVLAIGLGIMFIGCLLPGEVPDESAHFRRAYAISKGVFIANEKIDENGSIGSGLPEEATELDRQKGDYIQSINQLTQKNSGNETKQAYNGAALYNFVCYIPQSLAALIGRLLDLPILLTAYLMKIFNFIAWLFLIYFAIKMIPKFKTAVLFIALLPITLQEATSIAPDALTIGLSIFLVSYVLNLMYTKKEILKKKELMILYIMAILIGFCKIVYMPLILLYLLIPNERFGSRKRKIIHIAIIFSIVAILNISWLMISSGLLLNTNGRDSGAQLQYILVDPIRYMVILCKTIDLNLLNWMAEALGMSLGYLIFHLPNILFIVSFIIMILLFTQRSESLKMSVFSRCVFAGVFVIITGLIFTSLYIQWTPVGAELVDGIQGRYFLPILLLVPIILCRNEKDKRREKNKKYPALISENMILYYSMFVGVIACVTIFTQNI